MTRTIPASGTLMAVLAGILVCCATAGAQTTYDDQAKAILTLFESGQTDSAYAMIEPLKKSARFVPAVLYTRAQMTPDDRALGLYKEIIALDPGGAWADEAAWQLVRRYADKRDSSAVSIWAGVLRLNYPRSPYIAGVDSLLASPIVWEIEQDEPVTASKDVRPKDQKKETKPAIATAAPKDAKPAAAKDSPKDAKSTAAKDAPKDAKPAAAKDAKKDTAAIATTSKGNAPAAKTAVKPDDKKETAKGKEEKGDEKKETTKKPAAKETDSQPLETYNASCMRGYALQVGIYSTRARAEAHAVELKSKKNLRAVPLPKIVDGKKQYALVVGPYATIEDANKKKKSVAGNCDCQPLIVKVE